MKVFLPCKAHPSGFEAELKRYLESLDIDGYALMGFGVKNPTNDKVLQVDALIFAQPGKIVYVEAKGYGGNWTGNVNTEWKSDDLVINSTQTNPFRQVQGYGYIVKDILAKTYPQIEKFWVTNIVVARDDAQFSIEDAVVTVYLGKIGTT